MEFSPDRVHVTSDGPSFTKGTQIIEPQDIVIEQSGKAVEYVTKIMVPALCHAPGAQCVGKDNDFRPFRPLSSELVTCKDSYKERKDGFDALCVLPRKAKSSTHMIVACRDVPTAGARFDHQRQTTRLAPLSQMLQ